jgi:hypothetical protein
MPGQFLGQLTASLQQNASLPTGSANVMAVQIMLGQITQQAAVLAFGDAYRVTFVAALLAFCLGWLLPGRRAAAPGAEPMAMAGH